jgi:hypothetical protein
MYIDVIPLFNLCSMIILELRRKRGIEQLVRLIMEKLRKRVILTLVNPRVALSLAKLIKPLPGDVLTTVE